MAFAVRKPLSNSETSPKNPPVLTCERRMRDWFSSKINNSTLPETTISSAPPGSPCRNRVSPASNVRCSRSGASATKSSGLKPSNNGTVASVAWLSVKFLFTYCILKGTGYGLGHSSFEHQTATELYCHFARDQGVGIVPGIWC